MNRNYHEDIKINTSMLEAEWVEQSSLYLYYAEAHADAIDTRDRNKQNLEIEHARLDQKYRKIWDEKYPDTKMTEAAVKSVILQDTFYKKALDLLNKANHNVNLLLSAKTAFEHRKKALENLVSLHISGFHSTPKPPTQRKGGDIHNEITKKLNTKRLKNQKTKRLKRKN